MIHGVKDQPVHENFTVSDSIGNLVSGIDTTTGFIAYVYNPAGTEVTGLVSGFFTELGDGNYRYTFTPNVNGVWYINVTNDFYFSWYSFSRYFNLAYLGWHCYRSNSIRNVLVSTNWNVFYTTSQCFRLCVNYHAQLSTMVSD